MTSRGFTLLELLVSLLIFGILLGAFFSFFSGSIRATGQLDTRNELLQDAQTAQQLISSRIQEAWFVFEPSTTITLPSGAGTGADLWEVTRPGGSNQWEVGTHPILAFIMPPRNTNIVCGAMSGVAGSPPVSTATPPDAGTAGWLGCYRFLAYYPVTRASYVSNTATSLTNRLLADSENVNAWVLVQYSGYFASGVVTGDLIEPTNPASLITSANLGSIEVDLMADYVQQNSVPFALPTPDGAAATPPLGTVNIALSPSGTASKIETVTLNLVLQRKFRGRNFQSSGATNSLSTKVTARNVQVTTP